MLNLKKGLALVLAAATAFTFAPVANLGNAVEADAANTNFIGAEGQTLTVGEAITYDVDVAQVTDGTTYTLTNSNPDAVDVYVNNKAENSTTTAGAVADHNQKNHDTFTVVAKAKGEATVRVIYHGSNKAETSQDIHFTVVDPTDTPSWTMQKTSEYPTAVDAQNAFGFKALGDGASNQYTFKAGAAQNGGTFTITKITSSDESVVKAGTISGDTVPLNLLKAGTVKLTVEVTGAAGTATLGTGSHTISYSGTGKSGTYEVTINVIANKSTFKIGDSEITGDTNPNWNTGVTPNKWDNVQKTIYLSESHPSENIGATLTNPQVSGDKIVYAPFKENNNTTFTSSNKTVTTGYTDEISVSADGTVSATAKALNASEQYYFVRVKTDKESGKIGWVRVITTRNEKAFSTLKVSVQGKDYEEKASYDEAGNVKDNTSKVVDVKMSTQDRTSVPFTVVSSNAYDIKANDPSTVDVQNGTLVAKRQGVASVTISTKSDTTHYGSVIITLRVNVTNQKLDVKVVADPTAITLTKVTKSAKLNASVVATPALTTQPELSYRFVTKNTDGSYSAATSADFDLKGNEITYKTTNEATAIVEISTKSTNDYATPAPAYVTVTGTQKKAATKLNVTTKALNLVAGETGSVVASGTALSYTSSDTDVATVDASGVVTAVKPGVTVITVADAGNDEFAAGSENVTVYVKASYNDPKKVTGVKVSNKKGAKVTVTFTKDTTNPNMKYYVQKKVGKKTSGKSVGSNKATLSVKKGATVKVRVKAYYYDAEGTKHVGAWSSWKTFKTDKK